MQLATNSRHDFIKCVINHIYILYLDVFFIIVKIFYINMPHIILYSNIYFIKNNIINYIDDQHNNIQVQK